MKAIYSFWGKPFLASGGGYLGSHHFLHLLGLSVAYSRQHFSSVEMYCCRDSEAIWQELGWFDKVVVAMDSIEHLPNHHWAVAKLVTFSMQEEPFIHIDNDAWLMKGLPNHIACSPLIAQCQEHYCDFAMNYRPQIEAMDNYGVWPDHWQRRWIDFAGKGGKAPFAYNTGVFGGCDMESIQEYAGSAVRYMIEHGCKLPDLNTTIEQCYLAVYAQGHNVPVKGIISDWRNNLEAQNLGFRHYWGGTKKAKDKHGELNLDVITRRFEREFPEAKASIQEYHYSLLQKQTHEQLF